jgi:hypothetical protein
LYDQDTRYATWNYCWRYANVGATKENENSHKQKLPSLFIPWTLQDALTLTGDLQIKFLWIDALCVVQDDDDEWKIEVSRMQDIHSGSSIKMPLPIQPTALWADFTRILASWIKLVSF